MNYRQYSVVMIMAFAASLFIPASRLQPQLPSLAGNGELVLEPTAAGGPGPDFKTIERGVSVADVVKLNNQVRFKLLLDKDLYLVKSTCGPVSNLNVDPDTEMNWERVILAAEWACHR